MDGTYAQCHARNEDEALDIMARGDSEMVHGPIQGKPPKGTPKDKIDNMG